MARATGQFPPATLAAAVQVPAGSRAGPPRRTRLALGVAVLASAGLLLVRAVRRAVASSRGRGRDAATQEIAPGVHSLEVGAGITRSNVYFVRSGSSWTLIDAASANCAQPVLLAAESLFGADTRPAAILLTHSHPDHAGSAFDLARRWDCPVYLHPNEIPLVNPGDLATFTRYANPLDRWVILPLMRALQALPMRRAKSVPAQPSLRDVAQAFDPAAPPPGLPDWTCIPTPGHTPGHASFFRASDRVLIAADAASTVDLNSFPGFLQWALGQGRQRVSGPPWYSTWNWRLAKESVAALARLEPRVLACGHGAPITGERTARELRAFADRFSAREETRPWQSSSRTPASTALPGRSPSASPRA